MLTLLIVTILFIVSYPFLIKLLFSMMQDGGMWSIFGFHIFRSKLYASERPSLRLFENALGGCEQCTAFWWALPWTVAYYVFCNVRFIWVTYGLDNWFSIISVNIIWITIFWALCAGIGHWFLTYKNTKDAV